jgi:Arc/MetJ-type ribon-helix-helix transcriptional regulator
MQLTLEQQRRIQAVVDSGAYPSAEDALDAAVIAIERAALPGFEGTDGELESLLTEGLASTELTEEEFWNSIDRQAEAIAATHKPRTPR